MPRGIRKAPPTKFPPTMSGVKVSHTNRPWSKHAARVWEAASGSDSRRATPPSRMLIRSEDAASMVRLRILPDSPAKGKTYIVASMVPSASSAPPEYLDTAKRGRKAIHEILFMNWRVMGIDKMIQALQRNMSVWIKCKFLRMMQGDPQSAFFPAGTNDEIEVTLMLRDTERCGTGRRYQA